ncbi:Ubiquitin-like-specific protease 1 [Leptotrombidium deliense]|uniref:Ubiquitin-like-specific protease 1 n=1 Tax=Leptotrombidium deliense TaxID=299467 RepID=A0A443RXW7_9ACAR|nr:Ubiquitin-like-specific protease 1 [Leptotrombidium deliense]
MPEADVYEDFSQSAPSLSSYVDLGDSSNEEKSVYAESAGSVEDNQNLNDSNPYCCNDKQIFDVCDPPTDYKVFPFDSMESLLPHQWVSSFVIDPLIFEMIRIHNVGNAILFIPSYSFKYADILFYIIRYLYERDASKKSIILTAINLDNNHFVTGVILIPSKQIIILDSIKTEAIHRHKIFKLLFDIARITNILSSVTTRIEDYSFLLSTDCGTQSNSFDCGIYTLLNCLSIIRGIPYVKDFESDKMRRWITYIAHNVNMSNNGEKNKKIDRFLLDEYRNKFYDSVAAEKRASTATIDVTVCETESITINAH